MDKKFFFNNLGESFERLKTKLAESEQTIADGISLAHEQVDSQLAARAYARAYGRLSASISAHIMNFEAMREVWMPEQENDLKDISLFTQGPQPIGDGS